MTGFRGPLTLLEWFVILAMIVILAGVFLPALVRRRHEPSRRSTCMHNLRQLQFAAAFHEHRKNRLPGRQELIGGKRATWAVAVLADLGQQQLYDRWADDTISLDAVEKPFMRSFYCPGRPNRDESIASNSYVANIGFAPRSTDPAPFHTAITAAAPTDGYDYWDAQRKENGAFVDRYSAEAVGWNIPANQISVGKKDFRDGQSNTIMFSENLAAGPWHQPGLPTGMAWLYARETGQPVDPSLATGEVITTPVVPLAARINGQNKRIISVTAAEHARPSSTHTGGVNVAFADGSTRFLSEKIDYRVYQSLMALHDAKSDLPFRQLVLREADLEP